MCNDESWLGPTRTEVEIFSSSRICSATGLMKFRATSWRPGMARRRAVFCWSRGWRKSSPERDAG